MSRALLQALVQRFVRHQRPPACGTAARCMQALHARAAPQSLHACASACPAPRPPSCPARQPHPMTPPLSAHPQMSSLRVPLPHRRLQDGPRRLRCKRGPHPPPPPPAPHVWERRRGCWRVEGSHCWRVPRAEGLEAPHYLHHSHSKCLTRCRGADNISSATVYHQNSLLRTYYAPLRRRLQAVKAGASHGRRFFRLCFPLRRQRPSH